MSSKGASSRKLRAAESRGKKAAKVIPVAATKFAMTSPQAVAMSVAQAYSLSARETEVLVAAAQGRSMKEIAFGLRVSRKTVEYFWVRIFTKCLCRSQIEVMAILIRHACIGSATSVEGRQRLPPAYSRRIPGNA